MAGTPTSGADGTSGSASIRFSVVTISAFSFPDLIPGSAVLTAGKTACTVSADEILYRRSTAFVGNVEESHAGEIREPLGREVRGRAISSRPVRQPARLRLGQRDELRHVLRLDACATTMMNGTEATIATGTKSFSASKGSCGTVAAAIAKDVSGASSVYPSGAALATVAPANHASGPRTILDDDGSSERLGETCCATARANDVAGTAG